MRIPLYQVDAFTDHVFGGNPAAVCPLERWLPDHLLRAIAAENNLSETAFLVRAGEGFAIRWFTPAVEVDLCGHATLASAHVVFRHLAPARSEIVFTSMSGPLRVRRADDGLLSMRFPRRAPVPAAAPPGLAEALGATPLEVLRSRDYVVVLASEAEVRALAPDLERVRRIEGTGLSVTAPGDACDFVSRYFAPQVGIGEDPVTGSAHSTLVPYWSARLGKRSLRAIQVSARQGHLACEDGDDHVMIAGRAVQYLEGAIDV